MSVSSIDIWWIAVLQLVASYDRRDMQQVWAVLIELLDDRLKPDTDDITNIAPISYLPLGQSMLQSM